MPKTDSSNDLTCPFCKEDEFDEIGLKAHLFRWCERFDEVITPEEEAKRRLREALND